jgi:hypothetical protein
MFQFHIKQYGLKGDGSGATGSLPFQLILRVVGVAEASPKNIWVKDYATLAAAKTGAVAGVNGSATTTPVVNTVAYTGSTFPVDVSGSNGTWLDNAAGSESLSLYFSLPF